MATPRAPPQRRLHPNVLVYTGPGTSRGPVEHTLYTLRSLLSARYDVIPVAAAALASDSWQASTACIVIPGGRDEPYVAHLQPEATSRIAAYVRNGGSYLGICAGAYFAARAVEFELGREGYGIVGAREMRFFPGTAKGSVAPGFVYGAEDGAAAMPVYLDAVDSNTAPPTPVHLYVNGGPWFDPAEGESSDTDGSSARVDTLAWYDTGSTAGGATSRRAAIVDCTVGAGRAVLSGPHFEYPASATAPELNALLAPSDDARVALASNILRRLGLEVNDPAARADALADLDCPTLSEMHLCMNDDVGGAPAVADMMARLGGVREVPDTINLLRFAHAQASQQQQEQQQSADASGLPVVDILVHPPNTFPTSTPFDFSIYFSTLAAQRQQLLSSSNNNNNTNNNNNNSSHNSTSPSPFTFGSTVLYGRTVASTQTLLEKNSHLASAIPSGLLCTATHQFAGRGRGANAWISPPGALMFSLAITHAHPPTAVFVQYLTALAVVMAIKGFEPNVQVGIKWPNDVYARRPGVRTEGEGDALEGWAKVGGILVSSCFEAGVFRMVIGEFKMGEMAEVYCYCRFVPFRKLILLSPTVSSFTLFTFLSLLGCGINLVNPRPTLSIAELVAAVATNPTTPPLRIDDMLARIIATFDALYAEFAAARSFAPFLDRYYAAWLHS
ncbi:biotin holocarboxylase synthetase [Geranomyces michiganensis]|nr:biotin holocarboxylase synthetase [Geranomyces michiganensis]